MDDVIQQVTDLKAERDRCLEANEKLIDTLFDRRARVGELEESVRKLLREKDELTEQVNDAVRDYEETKRYNRWLVGVNSNLRQDLGAWRAGAGVLTLIFTLLLATAVFLP